MRTFLPVTYLAAGCGGRCPLFLHERSSYWALPLLLFGLLAARFFDYQATPLMTNIVVTPGHFLAMHEAGVSTCIGHCPFSWFSLPSLVPAALHTRIFAWCIVLCLRTWPIWSCRNLVRHAISAPQTLTHHWLISLDYCYRSATSKLDGALHAHLGSVCNAGWPGL